MTLPPLRREVLVACSRAEAYHRFVNEIGAWWPIEAYGCFGPGSRVALDGDRFVETGPSGETAVWGTITAADEPRLVSFTWHPGGDAEHATDITVTFAETGDEAITLVSLVHSGWERSPKPAEARDGYANGWVVVLGEYADLMPGRGERLSREAPDRFSHDRPGSA